MPRRKVSLAVLLSLSVSSPALFSEVIAEIVNWPAPPLWSAPPKPSKEAPEEPAVEPMSVAAVPTNPVPFVGITPCRIVDTRGNGFSGDYGPPALTGGVPRDFTLTGRCGLPAHAEAVSLNITVTNPVGPGFILVYPRGGAQPNVSTLNYVAGQTVANAAVVPLGTAGGITVIAGVSGTELIIDTNGYYGGNFDSLYVNEGQSSSVSSAMITDGAIVDADVSASAAIADTKLATISTAGKVADSALSSNVSKLGPSIDGGEVADSTITAADLADRVRTISIPLNSFLDCQCPRVLGFDDPCASGPNLQQLVQGDASEGIIMRFDAASNDFGTICTQLTLPADYLSGGDFLILADKATHSGNAEILNCALARNQFTVQAPGAVEITSTSASFYSCFPTVPASLAPGSTLRIMLNFTNNTFNDEVFVYSVAFRYMATD